MSFLPLILIAFLLFRKTDSPILELINNIDLNSITPILELLGINADSLNFLKDDNFKNFLAGNGDLKSLLPMLLTLIKTFTANTNNQTTDFKGNLKSEYLSPIKDIASSEITNSLSEFFT